MVCPFREGGAALGSDYGWSQLNGVYAMLCSAMWAWYRLGHDVMRAKAARALKDVYGYELHLNGGGCPWRLPGVDMDRAKAMMAALGLDPARFDGNAVALARLLDGEPDDYARLSGRAAGGGRPATGPDAGRSGVVEQFHNAFRRITSDWDAMLDRRVMDRNLEAMIPLAAHAVRVEREGGRRIWDRCSPSAMISANSRRGPAGAIPGPPASPSSACPPNPRTPATGTPATATATPTGRT